MHICIGLQFALPWSFAVVLQNIVKSLSFDLDLFRLIHGQIYLACNN